MMDTVALGLQLGDVIDELAVVFLQDVAQHALAVHARIRMQVGDAYRHADFGQRFGPAMQRRQHAVDQGALDVEYEGARDKWQIVDGPGPTDQPRRRPRRRRSGGIRMRTLVTREAAAANAAVGIGCEVP